jgi:hypothetical protein
MNNPQDFVVLIGEHLNLSQPNNRGEIADKQVEKIVEGWAIVSS